MPPPPVKKIAINVTRGRGTSKICNGITCGWSLLLRDIFVDVFLRIIKDDQKAGNRNHTALKYYRNKNALTKNLFGKLVQNGLKNPLENLIKKTNDVHKRMRRLNTHLFPRAVVAKRKKRRRKS